jgi:hypothetical protein
MRRLLRFAACLGALAVLSCPPPCSARAIVAPTVILGSNRINLVGRWSTALDPLNAADSTEFRALLTVTVLDVSGNPIFGEPVELDFSRCTSDIRLAATQSYHGQTVNCALATVRNVTGRDGRANFVVVGGLASRTDHPAGCAQVWVDSFLCGTFGVGAYDQNNAGGMTLADVAWFWRDLASGTPHDHSDLNGDGTITLADVAYAWGAMSGYYGGFDLSGAASCP